MSPWSVGVNVTKQEGNKETSKLRVFSVYSVFYAYGQRIFYAYASAYDVRRPTTATFYKCSSLPTSFNPSHLPPPKTNSLHALRISTLLPSLYSTAPSTTSAVATSPSVTSIGCSLFLAVPLY